MLRIPLVQLALLVFPVSLVSSQSLSAPDSLTQCASQPIDLNGGTPPYRVAALDSNNLEAAPLAMVGTDLEGPSVDWVVSLPVGSNVTLAVKDANNATAISDPIPVVAGDSDSCLTDSSVTATDATVAPETATDATPTSSSSSASFDELSVSSLIDSLTNFVPPLQSTSTSSSLPPLTTTLPPSSASRSIVPTSSSVNVNSGASKTGTMTTKSIEATSTPEAVESNIVNSSSANRFFVFGENGVISSAIGLVVLISSSTLLLVL
ncbi:uncharacterized protein JCM6883_002964 [Sporobolomyces salmoneus]|uniref:uncharacterized protein n=1 Tax=Sporobolomyces salmoneus TaxID=183962 RepID=UPI00316B8777